jgi:hypothetical protein
VVSEFRGYYEKYFAQLKYLQDIYLAEGEIIATRGG